MIKLEVYCATVQTVVEYRKSFTISEETHPELAGMSKDEMINYVKENVYEMPSFSFDDYDSLGDELEDAEIEKEKYVPQSSEITVEVIHE